VRRTATARPPLGVAGAQRGDVVVEIVGHTDPSGTRAHNLRLSRARAQAVADRLVELGLPAEHIGTVKGVAADEDPPEAAYTDGRFDETKAATLRRVVVRLVARH
jgi:outer membrane protein OmpA-like peptidoglycan-associated protein